MGLAHSPRIVTDSLVLCLDSANTKSYFGSWSPALSNGGRAFDGDLSTVAGALGGNFGPYTYTIANSPKIISARMYVNLGATSQQVGSTTNVIKADGTDVTAKAKSANAYSNVGHQWIDVTSEVGDTWSTFQITGTSGSTNPNIAAIEINGKIIVGNYSGTTVTDLSGNGNNGTLVNGVGYDSGNGGSFSFDGTNDYATIPNSTSLSFSTALTISVWFYIESGSHYLYLKGRTDSDHYNPLLQTSGRYGWVGADGRSFYDPPSGYIQTNTWYNLTASHLSGNDPSIYRNGVLSTSHSYGQGSGSRRLGTNNNPVSINADVPRGTIGNFNGKIAYIQAYNKALSAAEVAQNFNALRGRFGI
jgi:hypothetical protein